MTVKKHYFINSQREPEQSGSLYVLKLCFIGYIVPEA